MTEPSSSHLPVNPNPNPNPTETIQTLLQSLLQSQTLTYPQPTAAYLHPYAPLPQSRWKGKARAVDAICSTQDQLEVAHRLKECVNAARNVLNGVGKEDRGGMKLARALKEVSTHQSALYPITSSLFSLPQASAQSFPSNKPPLSPIDLLISISERLGIQTYLEDSQFGLLKTSLTLAGKRFVLDIDLEMDPLAEQENDNDNDNEDEDEDEDDKEGDKDNRHTGNEAARGRDGGNREGERGRIRLSKLVVGYVGKGGGTGSSKWVEEVLKSWLERYLNIDQGDLRGVEKVVSGLEGCLGELKELDEMGMGGEGFEDLEEVGTKVRGMLERMRIYPSPGPTVFPTFCLVNQKSNEINPVLRLRPAYPGEVVPIPFNDGSGDAPMTSSALSGKWVLEVVAREGEGGTLPGIPVRRSWLRSSGEGARLENTEDRPGIESLIYKADFPYSTDFIHHPGSSKAEHSLIQHWSMAQRGPEGFVVGHVGVPPDWRGFEQVLDSLRGQVVLNQLSSSVFHPGAAPHRDQLQGSENGSDIDLDDLMAAPMDIPITVVQREATLHLSFPLPHILDPDPPALEIECTPSSDPPYFVCEWSVGSDISDDQRSRVHDAVQFSSEGDRNLVDLVRKVDQSLR